MTVSGLPLYLLMVTYGREPSAIEIVKKYLSASKPLAATTFIVVDNYKASNLKALLMSEGLIDMVVYASFADSNKSAAANYAIATFVKEQEALIITIDNDISFDSDFLLNYYATAQKMGSHYYFGGSFKVNLPETIDNRLLPYFQGSAIGKSDAEYEKKEQPMFLGFNFSFFKSQWTYVDGFDERFGPGSETKLSGDESVFQKKMMYVGYVPLFVPDNTVLHKPEAHNYTKKYVLKRVRNNGYTHGFQVLVQDSKSMKSRFFKRVIYLTKRCFVLLFSGSFYKLQFRFYYLLGHLAAFFLYLNIDNKQSFFKGLDKDSV